MELALGGGVGVLHRNLGAELEVGAHRVTERLVIGHANGIEGRQIQLDEPLALLLADLQTTVNVDQVTKPELTAVAVRPPERLCGEPRQMGHMIGLTGAEQRLQQWVGEHAGEEVILEPVQALYAASVLEQRLL